MFGYVVLSAKDSSKEEQKTYRQYYCGLCHTLEKSYGARGKANLSYDFTFLSLLLSDLNDEKREGHRARCTVHPVNPQEYTTVESMAYAADMQMLLSYYAVLDGVKDDHRHQGKLRKLEPDLEALKKKYPRQAAIAEHNLGLLAKEEEEKSTDVEYNALLFGQILGEIFVEDENNFFAPDLMALGVGLGRFIYILDAWDDREKDRKKGAYNPLSPEMDEEKVKDLLMDAASAAAMAFERLPLDEHLPILRNILYSGIWTKFKAVKK